MKRIYLVRCLVIAISLALWYWTQWLLSQRKSAPADELSGAISDGIHRLTLSSNERLQNHPRRANGLLVSSSLVIDLLGVYLICSAVFGRSIEPFLGLLVIFALRQICQALSPLPTPKGMIWRDPGIPTLLVTYRTENDLFFSGHTAIAVFGAAVIASAFGPMGIAAGLAIAIFEIGAVLLLRAHYTMDVFTGAITALYVHRLTVDWAPTVDHWISRIASAIA